MGDPPLRPRVRGRRPYTGEWHELGAMKAPYDAQQKTQTPIAALPTVRPVFLHGVFAGCDDLRTQGKRYFIWRKRYTAVSASPTSTLRRWLHPTNLKRCRYFLSTSRLTIGRRNRLLVNEGPAVLKYNGKIFVTYSASATGQMYCIGHAQRGRGCGPARSPFLEQKALTPVRQGPTPKRRYSAPGTNCFNDWATAAKCCASCTTRDYSDEFIPGDPLNNPDQPRTHVLEVQFENGEPVFRL